MSQSGLSAGSGSSSNTSSAAPAIPPDASASTSAVSTTVFPRPTLMNRAVGFIAANAAASKCDRVCGVSGMVSIT